MSGPTPAQNRKSRKKPTSHLWPNLNLIFFTPPVLYPVGEHLGSRPGNVTLRLTLFLNLNISQVSSELLLVMMNLWHQKDSFSMKTVWIVQCTLQRIISQPDDEIIHQFLSHLIKRTRKLVNWKYTEMCPWLCSPLYQRPDQIILSKFPYLSLVTDCHLRILEERVVQDTPTPCWWTSLTKCVKRQFSITCTIVEILAVFPIVGASFQMHELCPPIQH